MATQRIAAVQTTEFRGNVEGALDHLTSAAGQALAAGATLLCFPEAFLQRYLTDEQPARAAAMDLGSSAFGGLLGKLPEDGPMLVFGLIDVDDGRLFNIAVVVYRRALIGRYRKAHLLTCERCFDAGCTAGVFQVNGLRFGINICHDTKFPTAVIAPGGEVAAHLPLDRPGLLVFDLPSG